MNTLVSLSSRELAHVLAGLRLLQRQHDIGLPEGVENIRADGDSKPLSTKQIDALCERINTDSGAPLVIVKVAGGAVQGTVANVPNMDVLVLDYDVEQDDHDFPIYPEFGEAPHPRDVACAWYESPLQDAAYTKQLRGIADADLTRRVETAGKQAVAA